MNAAVQLKCSRNKARNTLVSQMETVMHTIAIDGIGGVNSAAFPYL